MSELVQQLRKLIKSAANKTRKKAIFLIANGDSVFINYKHDVDITFSNGFPVFPWFVKSNEVGDVVIKMKEAPKISWETKSCEIKGAKLYGTKASQITTTLPPPPPPPPPKRYLNDGYIPKGRKPTNPPGAE